MASSSRLGVVAKVGIHVMALAMLATVTVMVVHDVPFILEENPGGGISPESVLEGAAADEDDLFAQLTAPENSSSHRVKLTSTATIPSTTQMAIQVPPGNVCVERATPKCQKVPVKCVKEGPKCTYKNVCLAREEKCKKVGICNQRKKTCRHKFSKGCVGCAKTTESCQHAHEVAKTCIPKCRSLCMKDAVCEQKCAKGCLLKYKGYIGLCKKQCKPCRKGANMKCWSACSQWKRCSNIANECKIVHDCVKTGKKCTPQEKCTKSGQSCNKVSVCVKRTKKCIKSKVCIRRDTHCSHEVAAGCVACRKDVKSTACKGEEKVKNSCNGDCNKLCASKTYSSGQAAPGQPECLATCHKGCAATQRALAKMCTVQCPACKRQSNDCHLRCLQEETQTTCNKVCIEKKNVEKCKPTCLKKEMRMSCVKVCQQKVPRKSCADKCQSWDFSNQRQCHHKCKKSASAVKYVCDKTAKHHCVQWSGGRVCDKLGACLRYKATEHKTSARDVISAPSSPFTIPLEPGPVIVSGDAFKHALKDHELPAENTNMPPLSKIKGLGDYNVPSVPPVPSQSKLGVVVQKATADVEKLLREDDGNQKRDEEILEETSETLSREAVGMANVEKRNTRLGPVRFFQDGNGGVRFQDSDSSLMPPTAYPKQETQLEFTPSITTEFEPHGLVEIVTAAESAREALAESQAQLLAAERVVAENPNRLFTESWHPEESEEQMSVPMVMIQEDSAPSRQSLLQSKAVAAADAAHAEWLQAQYKELAFEQLLSQEGKDMN